MRNRDSKPKFTAEFVSGMLEDTFELELEDTIPPELQHNYLERQKSTLKNDTYYKYLLELQSELIKLQDWVVATNSKIVILCEGRDSAGKGGVIKRITQRMDPRVSRIVALPKPTEREMTQWYFQRFVPHLPSGGEIVLFDRSWYNRAGVEKVMGFATNKEVEQFFKDVIEFEKMLVRADIILLKYWFSITDEEQQFRFMLRIHDPLKQWKLSEMDLQSRIKWEEYTKAKVWGGNADQASLGVEKDVLVTLPRTNFKNVIVNYNIKNNVQAPIKKGEKLGTLEIISNDKIVAVSDLIALEDVDSKGFFGRLWTKFVLWLMSLFGIA